MTGLKGALDRTTRMRSAATGGGKQTSCAMRGSFQEVTVKPTMRLKVGSSPG